MLNQILSTLPIWDLNAGGITYPRRNNNFNKYQLNNPRSTTAAAQRRAKIKRKNKSK